MFTVKKGDVLHFVPANRSKICAEGEIVVIKVGRVWVTTNERNIRFLVEDFTKQGWASADGGGYAPPGNIYASEKAYKERRDRQNAWELLRKAVSNRWTSPDHLSLADIARLLGEIAPEDKA